MKIYKTDKSELLDCGYDSLIDCLTHAVAWGKNLEYADLEANKLNYAMFNMARLKYANLGKSDFSNSSMISIDMEGACASRSSFTSCDMKNGKFERTNFKYSNLCWTDVRGANFVNANLTYTDMTCALTDHANFTGANLLKTKISVEQLKRSDLGFIYSDFKLFAKDFPNEVKKIGEDLRNGTYKRYWLTGYDSIKSFLSAVSPGDSTENHSVAWIVSEWIHYL